MSIPRNLSFLAENASSTGVLAVVGGGTGVTTSTGTGNVVLSTSPTLTTPNINSAQFATVSGTAPIYPCRAWVNFNGTGTVAIRASGNVSSITDNGAGAYTLNFTTAMADANYSIVGNCYFPSGQFAFVTNNQAAGFTTTTARIDLITHSGGTDDATFITVAIFR